MVEKTNLIVNSECMRDLCGEFHEIRNVHRNNMLVYLIPDATLKALASDPEDGGDVQKDYHELLRNGFEFMLNEYEPTKQVMHDWVSGVRHALEFTPDEIAAIVDAYYVHSVSASVESMARKIMG